ncbi:uncharacterized protein PV07_04391 [Cladophialophora immunda]|uniref:Uncharacterized protein n=1 Tax=Cladophialophora immunda TaxID=569365 RepID=A0A0D2CNP7_9EURO|nr:uncharacterized protein PV07_04391 [Cladophialophora immunda]KIW32878.1 hypothetical protein PV07_04391 [Cladophialophora immunda]OQV06768.1 hypothetical protein CLAIMM_11295 [Cladophialophora immunda]
MAKPIDNPCEDEPQALPFRTGGPLARIEEYTIFYFLAICSWCLEIAAACLGSLYGAQSHAFIGTITPFLAMHWMAFLQTCWMMATAPRNTIADRMAYLNLACRFQRLCAPTALIGMVTWAVAYRFRGKASSQAYWIIFLIVWILETVVCIMNVYNNISWESDLLYQLAPDEPQGNFWLAVLGVRSMCRVKHKHHENTEMELKQTASKRV